MKLSELKILILISILYSCNNEKIVTNAISSNNIIVSNMDPLDSILFCDAYAYFEHDSIQNKNYYRMPYNGCLYNALDTTSNNLGWADVILIPKHSYEKEFMNIDNFDKIDSLTKMVNKMPLDELKNKFKPIIFLIDKEYLYYMKDVEISYYPKLPYILKMFEYKDNLEKWMLIDSIEIHNELDNSKWIDMKITEKLTPQ